MAVYTSNHTKTYSTVYENLHGRTPVVFMATYALTTAMIDNANDELELCWVPAGAVITGVEMRSSDIDTDGSPGVLFDVGDDSDEDRIIAASTVGQAATKTDDLAAAGWGYKYTAKTKIKAYVKTAAVAGAAGTLYFKLEYIVDPNFTLAATVA